MAVRIPKHLLQQVAVRLTRQTPGGLSGWRSSGASAAAPYWQGLGYVTLELKSRTDVAKATGSEGAVLSGVVLFDLDPLPENGETPRGSDFLELDGLAAEVVYFRPPNSLIGYWKAEVRTGSQ